MVAITQGVSFERMMIFQRLLQIIKISGLVPGSAAYILMTCQVLSFPKRVLLQPVRDHTHPDLSSTHHFWIELS